MTKDDDGAEFLLIYASQTGQSKAIAEEFSNVTSAAGLSPDLNCMSGSEKAVSLACIAYSVNMLNMKLWRMTIYVYN